MMMVVGVVCACANSVLWAKYCAYLLLLEFLAFSNATTVLLVPPGWRSSPYLPLS